MLSHVEVIQPQDRDAVLAQIARAAKARRPHVKRHSAAAAELFELADRVFGPAQEGETGAHLVGARQRPAWRHYPLCQRHTSYHLTCAEFDMLEREADGFCDVCHYDHAGELSIDHDHAVGFRAVRGLVCSSCNIRLGLVDAGRRQPSRDALNYLSDPWYMRVGLEKLGCPTSCNRRDHGTSQSAARVTPRPIDQQRYLAAQLWALT